MARTAALRRVIVAMRIKPEHELRPPQRRRMGCHTCHTSQRQAMIAAHEDGQTARHGGFGGLGDAAGPADRFRQRMQMRQRVLGRRDRGGREVAHIRHTVSQIGHRFGQSGGAIGVRAHQATTAALATVHGAADQDDVLRGHGGLLGGG